MLSGYPRSFKTGTTASGVGSYGLRARVYWPKLSQDVWQTMFVNVMSASSEIEKPPMRNLAQPSGPQVGAYPFDIVLRRPFVSIPPSVLSYASSINQSINLTAVMSMSISSYASDSNAASQPHSQAFAQSTPSRQSGMVQPVVQEMFATVHAAGSSLFSVYSVHVQPSIRHTANAKAHGAYARLNLNSCLKTPFD
eukprot:scaffold14712_cov124-Isochrysis_galbana.AAC.2